MDEIKVGNRTEVSKTTWLLVLLIIAVAWLAAAIPPGEAVQAGAQGPCVVSSQVVAVGGDLTTHLAYPREATCGAGIAAPYPAVAFAHGFSMFGLSNGAQDNLGSGEHLASWGYVVALPELPDDFEARTAAMQQVLSYLEAEATSEGSFLYRRVDTDRLAAAGHSLGGATALALASRDPRIRAVVALDPVYHTGGPGEETRCGIQRWRDRASRCRRASSGRRGVAVMPTRTMPASMGGLARRTKHLTRWSVAATAILTIRAIRSAA